MKFRQLSEKWLENVKYKVATTTFYHYYQILNWYLYSEFEKLSVNRIRLVKGRTPSAILNP